ncbi:Hypothetical protein SRAE_0000036000 [Strongyloides ratti]|uniref:Uncharacterized protein n=1 Tax=Strongyloides ratti TaxID=34506 RepID=A0A090MSK4_STRRB|nr:Hypothetical protein SRAE_0000036000 [Strongyloides ratti]CEF61233.1 Hypothetical protein SRAE_0000036000 [Strongyloides ratti]
MASSTNVNVPVTKTNFKQKIVNYFRNNKEIIEEWAQVSSIHGIPHAADAKTTKSRFDDVDFPAITFCHSSPYSVKKILDSQYDDLKKVIMAYNLLNT